MHLIMMLIYGGLYIGLFIGGLVLIFGTKTMLGL